MSNHRTDYIPAKQHTPLSPGKALKILRELQGLSQSQLAARAGLTPSYILAIEKGIEPLGQETASHLAHALQVPVTALLFACEDENKI